MCAGLDAGRRQVSEFPELLGPRVVKFPILCVSGLSNYECLSSRCPSFRDPQRQNRRLVQCPMSRVLEFLKLCASQRIFGQIVCRDCAVVSHLSGLSYFN